MRSSSIWIIVALVVSMLSPITAQVTISSHNQEKCIGSLDVCNTSGSFISAHSEIPFLHESPCTDCPLKFAGCLKPDNLSFSPSWYFVQLERPPKPWPEVPKSSSQSFSQM